MKLCVLYLITTVIFWAGLIEARPTPSLPRGDDWPDLAKASRSLGQSREVARLSRRGLIPLPKEQLTFFQKLWVPLLRPVARTYNKLSHRQRMGIGWGGGIGGGIAQGATERRSLSPLTRRGLRVVFPRVIGPHHLLMRRENAGKPVFLRREVGKVTLNRRGFNIKALFGIGMSKQRQRNAEIAGVTMVAGGLLANAQYHFLPSILPRGASSVNDASPTLLGRSADGAAALVARSSKTTMLVPRSTSPAFLTGRSLLNVHPQSLQRRMSAMAAAGFGTMIGYFMGQPLLKFARTNLGLKLGKKEEEKNDRLVDVKKIVGRSLEESRLY
ncbi:hypothetical protein CBOM_03642 [Ceraceosorus bombacis]|uniref:Uncharacterized protein n=1 Tax=Ceraceosorus bombacis TaxID=401625 RepID=A0A0P1BHA0_9BASI|nr:hypothetical protein CBOM_03642 [Ceraceosorus bombacis]